MRLYTFSLPNQFSIIIYEENTRNEGGRRNQSPQVREKSLFHVLRFLLLLVVVVY